MKIKSIIKNGEERFIVVDENDETKVLDNANGYGYKSASAAAKAYNYKNRDKSKDESFNKVVAWAKKHQKFVNAVDDEVTSLAIYNLKNNEKQTGYSKELIENILNEMNIILPKDIDLKLLSNYFRSNREYRGLQKNKNRYNPFKKYKDMKLSEAEFLLIKKYNKTARQINDSKFLDDETKALIKEISDLRRQLEPVRQRIAKEKKEKREKDQGK